MSTSVRQKYVVQNIDCQINEIVQRFKSEVKKEVTKRKTQNFYRACDHFIIFYCWPLLIEFHLQSIKIFRVTHQHS